MRALLYIPLTVLAVTGCGWGIARAVGADVGTFEWALTAGGCLVAGALAALPALMARHSAQPAVAQAALVGTLIHMLGCAAVAAVVYVAKVRVGPSFPYWLMAFYFATLVALVAALAQQIRSAPPGPAGPTAQPRP